MASRKRRVLLLEARGSGGTRELVCIAYDMKNQEPFSSSASRFPFTAHRT